MAEAFPDLHHKMSKKIAQLTKVIYHLNTKNEDHQAELSAITASHENEVEAILRDAAEKVNKFKKQLDQRKAAAATEAQLRRAQEQHDAEKAAAMAQFEQYKEQVAVREDKMRDTFRSKLSDLRDSAAKTKQEFKQRVKAFADLQKRLESANSVSGEQMDELRRAHQEEVRCHMQ